MTNFEFYKDEIMKLGVNHVGVNKVTAAIVDCGGTNCADCLFRGTNCYSSLTEWLYVEHTEQPKLTKKERLFCELVETGYIARDSAKGFYCEDIFHYKGKPKKMEYCWDTGDIDYDEYFCLEHITKLLELEDMFTFITFEDEEPWKVEDLLKLEVVEE